MDPLTRLRIHVGSLGMEAMFEGLARAGKLSPLARPFRHGVEVVRNVAYSETGRRAHLLDVYKPPPGSPPRPVVLYLHGGAFQILSKDTHWIMGLAFARRGHVVFNANYRLAPKHPFPAALEDAVQALAWVKDNAHRFGGDPTHLVLAGESAGANLVTALTIALCYQRPETFARRAFDLGLVPSACLPACGMLQASDGHRFARRRKLGLFVSDRLEVVSEVYLPRGYTPDDIVLADPLVFLERGEPPDRALPPFFVIVGTRDPLLDDSRRLGLALEKLGVPCDVRVYEGELHAFHAVVFRRAARRAWRDTFRFLDAHGL